VGFDIRLEDEAGHVIDALTDPKNLLHALLPALDDEAFPCLRFIDPYGDTTFNQVHIPFLLRELESLKLRTTSAEERALVAKIQGLAQRGRAEPHLYVKFYGD
jgi:hypothetical protein